MLRSLLHVVLGMTCLAPLFSCARDAPWDHGHAVQLQPARPGQEDSLRRATYLSETLWLLNDAGELWSLRMDQGAPDREPLPAPAYDVCVNGEKLLVLTGDRTEPKAWTLRARQNGVWSEVSALTADLEDLPTLYCDQDRALLLTSRRLVDLSSNPRREIRLSEPVRTGLASAFLLSADQLYIGFNAGEWGGGLQRINMRTGSVATLEHNQSGGLCGGPLNTNCDPVNGLANLPSNPDCIAAAIGLQHMMAHGRIVQVCGTKVATLHIQPCEGENPTYKQTGEPYCSEAYYGLVENQGGLTALSPQGLTTIASNGSVTRSRLPAFKTYGPFRVSFGPQMILVGNSANQRHSLSGATPILVPVRSAASAPR